VSALREIAPAWASVHADGRLLAVSVPGVSTMVGSYSTSNKTF
jgi:hypothetical protein